MFMPKVLILVAHRPDRSPSQRYRFEQYLSYLESNGYSFTWSPLLNEKDDKLFYSKGNLLAKIFILLKTVWIRIQDLREFKNFDILFIQREALFLGTSFIEKRAKKSGKKVIFDFDDAIWLADTSPGNKKWEWVKDTTKFSANVTNASVVIAGNAYLAEKAKQFNHNTVIIPTTVDTHFHFPKPQLRNSETVIIGWSGSFSTIKHFESVLPVLRKLKEKHQTKIAFKVLGDANYLNTELNIKGIAWSAATEVDELNSFDIGIMPLPDDEWARGKCGLKGLTYMACGVPTVMSKVGVNAEIITNGVNGFLASSELEWFEQLDKLITDKDLREQIGTKGCETVKEKYSAEANKKKYFSVFKDAE